MKISQRIIITVSSIIALYTIASFSVIRIFIAPGFNRIELAEAQKDLSRARSAIDRELNDISSFCADYARWDDTYKFVQTGYASYTESNFTKEAMKQQSIDFICITDGRGQIIFSIYFDPQTGQTGELPDPKKNGSPFNRMIIEESKNSDTPFKGMITSEKGLLIAASCPVQDSKLLLPPNGRFFAGRFFGSDQTDKIRDMFKIGVSLSDITANTTDTAELLKLLQNRDRTIISSDAGITGYELIRDISGNPLAVLRVNHETVFAGKIIKPLDLSVFILLSCGIMVLIAIIITLNRNILTPLARLAKLTSDIAEQNVAETRLPEERSDEIGTLTRSFNRLLDKLYITNETLESRITHRTEALQQSNRTLMLMNEVFTNSLDGIVITNAAGNITNVNPAFTRITGFQENEAVGTSYRLMCSDRHDEKFFADMTDALIKTGRWAGELWAKNRRGRIFPEWVSLSTINDNTGNISHLVGVFHDISDAKQQESYIKYQAFHDTLTGLPNRILLNDRMNRAIQQSEKEARKFAILYLDLDNFKTINDSLGHEYGDILLQHVSERLEKLTRVTDTVCRLGGDEFVILLDDIKEDNHPANFAERIIASFGNPFVIHEQIFHIGTSIGIAVFPEDGSDTGTLIRNADTAMYKAKEEGRQRYRHFTNALNEKVAHKLKMETDLRLAIEANQFEVFYQPKLDLCAGAICGFEGLARWMKNDGIISPAEFIPLAEETGLIIPLDRIILETGCRQIAQLNSTRAHPLKIAINASAKTLRRKNLPDEIEEILLQTGMNPAYLEVEITETDLMKDLDECLSIIKRIADRGISIALDDFGIGYSSLAQLSKIPANTLKIDKSFVDMITGSGPVSIIETIYSMARDLHLSVVAEGVETETQLQYLTALGCDSIQGYYISRPVPYSGINDVIIKYGTGKKAC